MFNLDFEEKLVLAYIGFGIVLPVLLAGAAIGLSAFALKVCC